MADCYQTRKETSKRNKKFKRILLVLIQLLFTPTRSLEAYGCFITIAKQGQLAVTKNRFIDRKNEKKRKKKRGKRSNDERFMCHILRLNTQRFGTFGEGERETQITSSMEDNISQIKSQVRDKGSPSIPVLECTLI